ncbi:MAG: 3-hydroxyacyl-CoA dehydrogenase [Panacagrimonas sp.]|nr:3-hydroxyacyl-CoA dehydrogenase NAD-binding domain-containing protein [Panacagrimonas sp.]MCC2657508.1 3-hydroxyacyl-CoA dehydrogenase [Panacagrimonas sp.]
MAAQVHYRTDGDVAVLTIDNPPVNAASHAVRSGIVDGLHRANGDASVNAIVLIGGGRTFIAGADIREFGQTLPPPHFPDVIDALEGSAKPVVAALHGTALGGGLEFALACHYRVALAGTKLGLPEVNLGLLPGAGGTQRLPRIVGPSKALEMILSGKPLGADEALKLGLVQQVTGQDLSAAAVAFARARAATGGPHPRARDLTDKVRGVDRALFAQVREQNARKWAGRIAELRIVECVEAACFKPTFDEGSAVERDLFVELRNSPQSKALRYAFFAEREAAKIPGLPDDLKPRSISSAAVIGAGTMGGGIAMCFANAGIPVQILDASQPALDAGMARVRDNYATSVARGSMPQARADAALELITTATRYEDIGHADVVVEAVFEDLAVKHEVFRTLDRVMKPGALLASNTSTLDVDAIASATHRPQDVIGTHFFSPANVMKLQENVRGEATSPETIARAMQLAKTIGKVPVLAGNCHGFIGNRILYVYGRECDFLLEEGATPWQIDRALQGFGFPMGLYLMRDLAGLDVGWRVRKGREAARDKSLRYSPVADRICELGRFGQKTGAGYYRYEGRKATPDPEIEKLIESVAAELGVTRRAVTDEEIVTRVLTSMANEGARILGEGIAIRASDIDVTYLYGYGFPRHQGGPMFWAEQQGLDRVLETVKRYEAEQGVLWAPAPLLVERAKAGKGWAA